MYILIQQNIKVYLVFTTKKKEEHLNLEIPNV